MVLRAPGDQVAAMKVTDEQASLIAQYIEPHPYRAGPAEVRIKGRGVSVWALIGSLRLAKEPGEVAVDQVAEAYQVPRDAVRAALAYYAQHRTEIDARLAENDVA
jgi:uncharacterized protein (DUF433 family)